MQFIETYNEYPLDWGELSKSNLDVDYQKHNETTKEKLPNSRRRINRKSLAS